MNDSLDHFNSGAMANTNMVIPCPSHLNCSEIRSTPGANIASPIGMFLTGTIGNAIAIMVLHRNSRREQMRTVFYVLVGSLAWTDLNGIILTTIPVVAVYVNGSWVGGVGMCNYHAFTMIFFGLITPCIVCTMAVERYLGIRHGYFYKKHVNRSRVRLVLLVQWIFVLIFTSLPLFGLGQYAHQYPGTWCFFNLHPTTALDSAYAYTYAIFNLLLILIIVVCNIVVIATLIGMRHRRKHFNSPSRERQVHRSPRQREIEIQMVILLVGITVLFTTCWAPLMIQIVMNQINGHGDDHRQDLLAIRLASINQSFDPWVYILFRKVIFTKFWKYVRGVFISGTRLDSSKQSQKIATVGAAQHLLQPNGNHHIHHHNNLTYHKTALQSVPHYHRADMPPTAIGCRELQLGESCSLEASSSSYSYGKSKSPDDPSSGGATVGGSHRNPADSAAVDSSASKTRTAPGLTKEPTVSSCLDECSSTEALEEGELRVPLAAGEQSDIGGAPICHCCKQPINSNGSVLGANDKNGSSFKGLFRTNGHDAGNPGTKIRSETVQDSENRKVYRAVKSSAI